MRRAALLGSIALLLAVAVPASAGDGDASAVASASSQAAEACGFEYTRVDPVPETHVFVELQTRDCPEGRSLMLAVGDGAGRLSVEWYDDERGRGLEVFHPPYFVSWTDTDRGCVIAVFVFGMGEVPVDCVAGSPPPPPILP